MIGFAWGRSALRAFVLLPLILLLSSTLVMRGEEGSTSTIPKDEPFILRVMTYNIQHCRGMDNVVNVQRIANVINASQPDIVSLQEVDNRTLRSNFVDQAAELGRLTGMYFRFGKAINYQGGQYGQAILSRWPIGEFHLHELPTQQGQEQRIGIVAEIPGTTQRPTLLFAGTHLHHASEDLRLPQAIRMNSIMRQYPHKEKILSGDMNAQPGSLTMHAFAYDWVDTTPDNAFTIPSGTPNRKFDYILLPEVNSWRVVHGEVINEPMASDHRPVLVVLEWAGGETWSIY